MGVEHKGGIISVNTAVLGRIISSMGRESSIVRMGSNTRASSQKGK